MPLSYAVTRFALVGAYPHVEAMKSDGNEDGERTASIYKAFKNGGAGSTAAGSALPQHCSLFLVATPEQRWLHHYTAYPADYHASNRYGL